MTAHNVATCGEEVNVLSSDTPGTEPSAAPD
jgi:hypothetical protein